MENKQAIEYLFGQLKSSHPANKKSRITVDDILTTYTKQIWTKDKTILMEFLHLGASPSIKAITPFLAKDSSTELNANIKPTLSPNDPNFSAWWEQHKAEWETRKKTNGQEPFDD